MYKLAIGIAFGLLLSSNTAMATCPGNPKPLTNGTTADGTDVIANFDNILNCLNSTINFTNNVGIGAPSPATLLTLGDGAAGGGYTFTLNGGTNSAKGVQIAFQRGGASKAWIGTDSYIVGGTSDDLSIAGNGSTSIRFYSNTTETARFNNSGSFLVGTTTNGGWSGTAKLETKAPGTGSAISAYVVGGAGGGNALLARVDNTAALLANFFYTTTGVGTITTNGTTTSYNTTSDERLKDWGVPQRSYSETIRNLWVGDFRWKKTGVADFGYRAQQTYSLFPEAVHKPADPKSTWEMDYGKTAALAMWGVKDLYKANESQARDIAALRTEVKQLRVELVAAHQVRATKEAAMVERLEQQVTALQRKLGMQTAMK